MVEITMRRITLQDVPALSYMAKNTFYDTFTGTCTQDDMNYFLEKYYNESVLADEVMDSKMEYYFAEINDEPIGYILFAATEINFDEIDGCNALELKRFYVNAAYHGKGVAQKMMQFYLDYAVSKGYDVVFLGVWEHNVRAQKFYKKYGFTTTSHTHDFPIGNTPQTDMYMWRKLRE